MAGRFIDYPETTEELTYCWIKWNKKHGSSGPLRFGQWMIVEYASPGIVWPELFYEPDHNKAFNIILKELENEDRK